MEKSLIIKNKNRIDYIDLSKGFCILLVVFYHVCQFYHIDSFIVDIPSSFHMPFFFIISGLFFKKYNSFFDFLRIKTNKLFIPFVAFYIICNCYKGIHDYRHHILSLASLNNMILGFWTENFINNAIWFLLCLFFTNIIFYMVLNISKNCRFFLFTLSFISIIIGLIGCFLGKHKINLPMFLDTSMTVLPFFSFGYIVKQYTPILYPNKYDKYNWLIIVCLSFFFLVPFIFGNLATIKSNNILVNPIILYICGITGSLFVFFLSKEIKWLPLVSYMGRYSIMILLTHFFILSEISSKLVDFCGNVLLSSFLVFLIVIFICFLLIPLMKKYLPHITAQKDFI